MTRFVTRISLPGYLLALVGTVLIWSITTQAKLTVSSSVLLHAAGTAIYETDFAFDTESNVGLGVFRQSGTFKVRGVYMGPTGQPAAPVFDLTTSSPTEVKGPRVAARSGGGGGFLVTYFLAEIKQKRAIFVHPSSSTILGPALIDVVTWAPDNNSGGVAYVPEHDAFLVAYRKNADTFVKWVKVVGGSLQVSSSAVQVTSGDCNYIAPEISWDFERNRALVTGWTDGCGGGVWMRRVSFDGSTISALGSQANIGGASYEDVRVAFSDLMDKWLLVYVKRGATTPRHVLGNTVDANGVVGSQRTILPANTSNSTIADNRFARDNGLGLAYNPFSGRFLVSARGHDDGDGLAPLYAVELDTSGVAIPKTFAEVLSFDVMNPWPRLAAVPNSQNFLIMAKAGQSPAGSFSQLRSIKITADGQQGTGTWPSADGGGSGGGGEEPPPPPPPPSGSFTLTITRPTSGLIVGPDIWCGTTSSSGTKCSVTKPAGTSMWLNAYPGSGYALTSWGGCSPSFALNANTSCAPTFGSTSPLPPPPPPPPSGSYTLTITRPTNGLIAGPDIWCGTTSSSGTKCSVTKPAGTSIWLNAYPASGHALTSWGGCTPSFPLNANKSCAPTFSP
jgi:hypothetical protein